MAEGEHWFFDGNVVVLKPIMKGTRPSELAESLMHTPFWVGIYDCPFGGKKEKRIKAMAESIGSFVKIDDGCTKGWTKPIRIKS